MSDDVWSGDLVTSLRHRRLQIAAHRQAKGRLGEWRWYQHTWSTEETGAFFAVTREAVTIWGSLPQKSMRNEGKTSEVTP